MHINSTVIINFAWLDNNTNFNFHFQSHEIKFEFSLTKLHAITKKSLLITSNSFFKNLRTKLAIICHFFLSMLK